MVDSKTQIQADEKLVKLEIVQKEVVELLKDISILLEHSQRKIVNRNSPQKSDLLQQQFSDASSNVADLQLRMSIVAPMKAGKSTIINAIAGQELLPSCATAMTTMPTEIVFSSQLKEPVLEIDRDTIKILQDIYQKIGKKIEQSGRALVEEEINRYPHLNYLLTKIEDKNYLSLSPEIKGKQAINDTLNDINHLIRLSSVIEPLSEPLAQLTTIPRIQTPFLGLAGIEQAKTLGDLVIIDTPGPNEAGANLKLTAVVEEQLRRSSIILIVLDYTQLNNEAAEAIKKQVQPIIDLIGKENLYVLVNKIDQRRKGDLTTEQVRDFVIADLDLEASTVEQRVFEISAIRAFAATQFLLEVNHKPEAKLLELNSLETLAQEVFGIDWDEELEDIDVGILNKKARKLWKKSGFAPFLEKAIANLMVSAAPRSLMSALNLSRHRLLELQDDINLRGKAITKSKAKLKQEIQALQSDLVCLESCRKNLQQVEKIKADLHKKLEVSIDDLKQEAKVNLETYFAQKEFEKGDFMTKADIKTRELLLTNVSDFNILPKFLSQNIKSNLEPKTTGIINFTTEKEAAKFTQDSLVSAKQRLESLLLLSRQKIEAEVQTTNHELKAFLQKETQPIVDRARTRIKKNFEIDLELPSPSIDTRDKLQVEECAIKRKTRLVDGGYEERTIKKRAWYYWFGIVPFYSQEMYQKPYKKENYYAISAYELVNQINHTNHQLIDEIKLKLINYLEEDIQQQVDSFFANLDEYFGIYLKNIKEAQQSKELSLEQRTKLIKVLYCLLPETANFIEKTNNYLHIVDEYISVDNK